MQISGHKITLGDGNTWLCPMLWRWDMARREHVPNLPSKMAAVMVDGVMRGRMQTDPTYAPLDALAEKLFQGFVTETRLSLDDALIICADLIGANYRVGVPELSLLGLLDEELAAVVLGLAIDVPTMNLQSAELASQGLLPSEPPAIQEEEYAGVTEADSRIVRLANVVSPAQGLSTHKNNCGGRDINGGIRFKYTIQFGYWDMTGSPATGGTWVPKLSGKTFTAFQFC